MKQLIKKSLIIRILTILVLMLRIFTLHSGQGSQDNTKTIFSGVVNNTLNIKNAASGVYFVQVFYKDGSVDSHKLSIIK